VQLKAFPAFAAPEDRLRFGNCGLEILFVAWLDVDLCDFGDHVRDGLFAGDHGCIAKRRAVEADLIRPNRETV
jgi:hypothetical protein